MPEMWPRRIWVNNSHRSSHKFNLSTIKQIIALRTNDRQFDNFVVTGGTVSCHNDNLQYHQWWQICQIDHLLFSVNTARCMLHVIYCDVKLIIDGPSNRYLTCWSLNKVVEISQAYFQMHLIKSDIRLKYRKSVPGIPIDSNLTLI